MVSAAGEAWKIGDTKTELTHVFIAGLSLTKADLILSGSGSTPGSNAGGGYSWMLC